MIKYLVILVIVVIFFGAGKLPQVMGDLGKGIKALKDGLTEDPKKPEVPKEIAKEGDNDKTI